jgi:hypothetical protein
LWGYPTEPLTPSQVQALPSGCSLGSWQALRLVMQYQPATATGSRLCGTEGTGSLGPAKPASATAASAMDVARTIKRRLAGYEPI